MAPDSKILVAFRVDASVDIGTGHVMRCLTLADQLHNDGAQCVFLCRHLPREIAIQIVARKHGVHTLTSPSAPIESGVLPAHASWLGTSQQADAEECIAYLRNAGAKPVWLVVDHYALDATWEQLLQPHAQRILAIDDLADRQHVCDALLDQNLHTDPAHRYRGRVGPDCALLLGPRYALLRPEFAAMRQQASNRSRPVKRLLVSMGGIDRDNDTARVIEAFLALKRDDLFLDVIASVTNPHLQALYEACNGRANIALHAGTASMATLMAGADLAIGAGGISTWERCCVGLPALVISIAANQEPGCHALTREGAILYVGPRTQAGTAVIHAALSTLLQAPGLLESMSKNSAALVDGLGAGRVARLLLASSLHLRPAGEADCANVLAWRNHENTRRFSDNPELIGEAEHRRWFMAALADPARRILIGEQDGRPVGVLRYDIAKDEALVSIFLVPGNSGRGVGPRLLTAGERWLAEKAFCVRRIRAHVLQTNIASLRAFETAGFKCNSVDFLKVL